MTHHLTPETENVEFNEVTRNNLMAAINSLKRLICHKSWGKYQTCRVVPCYNYLIILNHQMLFLVDFVTIFYSIDLTVSLNC